MDGVVITGSPHSMMPVPISLVDRNTIEQNEGNNLLPVLMQQVPGLFVTSRGIAGYGVSVGSAEGVLILIDGHPQYATIYGHPIADAYIIDDGCFEGGTPRPYLFNSTDYMNGANLFQAVSLFKGKYYYGRV